MLYNKYRHKNPIYAGMHTAYSIGSSIVSFFSSSSCSCVRSLTRGPFTEVWPCNMKVQHTADMILMAPTTAGHHCLRIDKLKNQMCQTWDLQNLSWNRFSLKKWCFPSFSPNKWAKQLHLHHVVQDIAGFSQGLTHRLLVGAGVGPAAVEFPTWDSATQRWNMFNQVITIK